ncbi:dihydrodipicolinate synthase family protein [Zymomonas mobilis]|uniref:dihydrodipicolinate synthase family protein n=1 Tax=Zymomonas mobilis TaxID=542 RepID=UPI0039EA34FD
MDFSGLSAFPITPINEEGVDQAAFEKILQRLVDAGVNSIGVEGSTGNYPYLTEKERIQYAALAVKASRQIPVIASIGAFRTRDILLLSEQLQKSGVSALLLPLVSYHALNEDEVFSLYETVSKHVSVPVIVYDSPLISRFAFSDDLYQRICQLPHIQSIKVPSAWPNEPEAYLRLQRLMKSLPSSIQIGVSGDPTAANALKRCAKIWYSEWGGIFPQKAKELLEAAFARDEEKIFHLSLQFEPFWEMSRHYGGSIRPIAAAASILRLTNKNNLPLPLMPISMKDQDKLKRAIVENNMN